MSRHTAIYASIIAVMCSCANTGNEKSTLLLSNENDDVARCIRQSGQPDAFVETRYVDDTPMPLVRPEETQRGFLVSHRHWMDLVFPNSVPKREEITSELSVFAARGEYEPITFSVTTLRHLRSLEVRAGELISPSGGRLAAPEIQIVRCAPRAWLSEEPAYEGGPVGVMNMPTYLERSRLLDVPAERSVRYWLTVKIEHDATPGIYEGEAQISHAEGKPYSIKIKVEVLPIRLMDPPQALGFWDFQRPYQGEIGTLDDIYQMMGQHGVSAVFTRTSHYEHDRKRDTSDFSKYISIDDAGKVTVTLNGSTLEVCMNAARRANFKLVIYHPNLPELVSREVADRYDRKILEEQTAHEVARVLKRFEGSKNYETIKAEITNFSKKYDSVYSQAYADLYVDILREILKEVKKRDWPTLVVAAWDEAWSHHRRNKNAFPFVLRHLELRKRAGALTSLNHCSPFLDDEYGEYVRAAMKYLDIAIPAGRLSSDPKRTSGYNATVPQLVEAFGKQGIMTYNYSLSGQPAVRSDLSVIRFSAGFYFHTLGKGVRGNFDYIYFRPEGDPYNPIDDHNMADNKFRWSHERLWFFPPREKAGRFGGRSLMLAAKREGFDDLRYLQTLDTLIQQARAETNSDAQRTAGVASARLKRILESFTFSNKALDSNIRNSRSRWDTVIASRGVEPLIKGKLRLHIGWDYETYDRSRRDIAEAIIKLQQALAQ